MVQVQEISKSVKLKVSPPSITNLAPYTLPFGKVGFGKLNVANFGKLRKVEIMKKI